MGPAGSRSRGRGQPRACSRQSLAVDESPGISPGVPTDPPPDTASDATAKPSDAASDSATEPTTGESSIDQAEPSCAVTTSDAPVVTAVESRCAGLSEVAAGGRRPAGDTSEHSTRCWSASESQSGQDPGPRRGDAWKASVDARLVSAGGCDSAEHASVDATESSRWPVDASRATGRRPTGQPASGESASWGASARCATSRGTSSWCAASWRASTRCTATRGTSAGSAPTGCEASGSAPAGSATSWCAASASPADRSSTGALAPSPVASGPSGLSPAGALVALGYGRRRHRLDRSFVGHAGLLQLRYRRVGLLRG